MNNRRSLLLLCCTGCLLAVLVAGCSSGASNSVAAAAAPTTPPTATIPLNRQDRIAAGLKVYNAHYCTTCHSLDADDAHSQFGPTHNHIATTAAQRIHDPNYHGTAKTAEEYIRESIVNPKAYIVSGFENTNMPMPTFKLRKDEVNALVQMLMLQK